MKVDRDAIRAMHKHPDMFRDYVFVPSPGGPRPLNDIAARFQRKDFRTMNRMARAVRDQRIILPRFAWIERTKGASKTSDISIVLLWIALFSQRMILIQVAASDEEQAGEVEKVIRAVLKLPQNAWIAQRLRAMKGQIVNPSTGTAIEILSADELGSHGARPDVLVVDEVSHAKSWPFVETLLDNLMKMPGGIGIFGTNAGLTTSPAYKLRELARTSPLWSFSAYTEPAPWLNAAEIAERRRVSTASRFKRLWSGQWTAEASDGIDPDLLQQCITLPGPHMLPKEDHTYFVGVDSAVRRDLCAAVTLAVHSQEKRIKLTEVQAWAPPKNGGEIDLNGVEMYLRDLHRRFQPAASWVDPSHFWGNVQRMRGSGFNIEARPVTAGMLESFANALLSAFNSRLVDLFDGPLIADIAQLEIEDLGSRLRVKADRGSGGHADRAFAFCMALVPAIEFLKFGAFEAGTSAARQFDPRAAGIQIGTSNAPADGERAGPLQRKFGIQLAGSAGHWDHWHRRPLSGGRFARCIQFHRTR